MRYEAIETMILQQYRKKIDSGAGLRKISRETKIDPGTLSRIYHGTRGLSKGIACKLSDWLLLDFTTGRNAHHEKGSTKRGKESNRQSDGSRRPNKGKGSPTT